MCRQIALHHDDWNFQRIVWYDSNDLPLHYQLTTVTYGLNCAPFLALRTMQQLVMDEGNHFPKGTVPMIKGRYMDDIFGAAETIPETIKIIHQLTQLCQAGQFPLQKWNSNYLEVLPKTEGNTQPEVEIETTLCKILGLIWKPESDTLHFLVTPSSTNPHPTKRIISSEIAKLFDPLGLISPILVRAKIMLQEIWCTKIGWDDPLTSELQRNLLQFRLQLQQLDQLSIPKWIGSIRTNSQVKVHGFSDASEVAMAAVIYVRIYQEEGRCSTCLVRSKTKIAPLKRLTIPRLELNAALLLARLLSITLPAIELGNSLVYCWSDSSVALTWINHHPRRWKDYVQNRVTVINEVLPNSSWRFVPGTENPADCAPRGMTPQNLNSHELWWKGPK